ncbi:DUF4037 domain-containing protein [Acidaminobacter sp. JC074]|uniref:nucleotidyltransferase domain-containing protein n=1 Tax=Acidaminobacter sp. JC074 TaxID=2530199 RepID=UPI001F0E29B9|nr:nucleotidyltransferase domain-containing protein [Acidaminobacter sp. JC074]MCH4886713.1 DUF4037 domain-containing protein [Acidaminobacter sp. JC074]
MYFEKLVERMKEHPKVVGIMLGGSRANGSHDDKSDYDVYVYVEDEIPEEERRHMIAPFVGYMEYSNRFWELEDDGILLNGVDIEFIYRAIDDIDSSLQDIVLNHNAWSGYTTCFWDNLVHSKILYDKDSRLQDLVEKYSLSYPQALKMNIVVKNCLLLSDYMPSFYYQLEKAVNRNDMVSINHRLTELLASYFDVIFALNETLHPGEKRLIEKTKNLEILPSDYLDLLEKALNLNGQEKLSAVKQMILNLYDLVKDQGISITVDSYANAKSDL